MTERQAKYVSILTVVALVTLIIMRIIEWCL